MVAPERGSVVLPNILTFLLAGLVLLVKLILDWLRRLLRCLLRHLHGKGGRDFSDKCCADPPPSTRARPDPYIYSQEWLTARGYAVTWDNPDFEIVDPATGLAVDNHNLQPHTTYHVRVRIHDGSTMAAFGTQVRFQVLRFGAGTVVTDELGTIPVDVPAAGSAIAEIDWTIPATGGHNCLKAIISHPDDANTLNNVGQHNTDTAVPASPTRKLTFSVGNGQTTERRLHFRLDGYRLPHEPMRAKSFDERQSLAYLRRLQAANAVDRHPVPAGLNPRLSHEQLVLKPGTEAEVTIELDQPAAGREAVNIAVFDGGSLVGGVTCYVDSAI